MSFPDPEQALGRELCQGLQLINQLMKRDNFEYHERFTHPYRSDVSPRLGSSSSNSNMMSIGSPQRPNPTIKIGAMIGQQMKNYPLEAADATTPSMNASNLDYTKAT